MLIKVQWLAYDQNTNPRHHLSSSISWNWESWEGWVENWLSDMHVYYKCSVSDFLMNPYLCACAQLKHVIRVSGFKKGNVSTRQNIKFQTEVIPFHFAFRVFEPMNTHDQKWWNKVVLNCCDMPIKGKSNVLRVLFSSEQAIFEYDLLWLGAERSSHWGG